MALDQVADVLDFDGPSPRRRQPGRCLTGPKPGFIADRETILFVVPPTGFDGSRVLVRGIDALAHAIDDCLVAVRIELRFQIRSLISRYRPGRAAPAAG